MYTLEDTTFVTDAARGLGEALKKLPEYIAFKEAQEAFDSNPEVQELVARFNALIPQLNEQQKANGKPDNKLFRHYKEMSRKIETHPVIHELMNAQKSWKKKLEEVNESLSSLLEIEFAEMARPEGGCC